MAVQDAGAAEDDEKALYLAKCVQRSSAVSHAVCGHIRSPLTLDVVFGKETALELVVLAEDGSVQSVCEQPVFGTIKEMKLLKWNENYRAPDLQTYGKDLLVLLSDSGKLSFLTFSVEFHRFLAVSQVHLAHPGVSLRELGWLLAAESSSRAVAVAAFEDQLTIYPTSIAAGVNVVDKGIKYIVKFTTSVRDSGYTIWSLAFVAGSPNGSEQGATFLLAVLLHRRGSALNEVHVLCCDPTERSIQLRARYNPSGESLNALLALSIVEMPAFPGFLLLLQPGGILLVDVNATSKPYVSELVTSALIEFSTGTATADDSDKMNLEDGGTGLPLVSAWCWDPEGLRLAFSLDTGDIYIGTIHFQSGRPSLTVDIRYRCSSCRVLLWTNGGFITAMVEMGDGQVLKVGNETVVCQSTIQNVAPILDFSLADYYGEKQDQMFACCGGGQEGSVRIIRNGNSVERLICTPPVYQGVTGIWTLRLRFDDPYHAFFIISFVEETRVLSVGLNFVDITDAVGFEFGTNTLACGLIEDGWLVQISSDEVRLCCPTKAAHSAGIDYPSPLCTYWRQQEFCISVGAVARGKVILALSRPGRLVMLGTKRNSVGTLELTELQYCFLEAEISCISFPQGDVSVPVPPAIVGLHRGNIFPADVDLANVCVVGTHKPSVELLSIVPGGKFAALAIGHISLVTSVGTSMSGCIPQDVRLALFDRLYILAGLRNGMLLRYEWPDSSLKSQFLPSELFPSSSMDGSRCIPGEKAAQLCLIAVRRLGVSPVFLVPLEASLRSDIIALSDRPWLLEIAHSQRISYTSISFQPSTHVTPVCSKDCPKGIIFLADCSLHLVEMEHSKTLNVQKLHLGSTPRRILYHTESKTLLVLRTAPQGASSELICVNPLSGTIRCLFAFERGEVAKCMQFMRFGSSQLLLVGTSSNKQRPIMPTGEVESSLKGHLMVIRLEPKSRPVSSPGNEESNLFSEAEEWELVSKGTVGLPGPVLAVAPYLGQYVIASAGNNLFCLGFSTEGPVRLKKITSVKTRFLLSNISVHFTTIAVGDCRDGLLLYTFREDTKKLEQLQCDPMKRLIADCALVDIDTAVVMDRQGNFSALSSVEGAEENGSPERNLTIDCWFHLGEISMSIRKGSFAYKASVEDASSVDRLMHNMGNSCIVASTLLGSVFIFIRVTREEYNLLAAVQARLSVYPPTAPVLGNNHARFRGQGCPASVSKALDGDMLAQFLDLTSAEQVAMLKEPGSICRDWVNSGTGDRLCMQQEHLPVEQVLRLLERIHHTLT